MPAPRIQPSELQLILKRKGYGIESELKNLGYGVSGSFGKSSSDVENRYTGQIDNVEPNPSHEQVGAKGLQIKCAGKVRVRVKFYRRRLADYSRAISEKAFIDALQYSGAIRGDSEKEIWLIDEGQVKVDSDKEERTEITIEYPEVDLNDLWEEKTRMDGR